MSTALVTAPGRNAPGEGRTRSDDAGGIDRARTRRAATKWRTRRRGAGAAASDDAKPKGPLHMIRSTQLESAYGYGRPRLFSATGHQGAPPGPWTVGWLDAYRCEGSKSANLVDACRVRLKSSARSGRLRRLAAQAQRAKGEASTPPSDHHARRTFDSVPGASAIYGFCVGRTRGWAQARWMAGAIHFSM